MGLLSPSSEFESAPERAIERRSTVIFRVGIAIYVLSLFLIAVKDPLGTPVQGFLCLIGTLNLQVAFLDGLLRRTLGSWPAVQFAMLPSGWTNILVATTIWNQWMRPGARTTSLRRVVTVANNPLVLACDRTRAAQRSRGPRGVGDRHCADAVLSGTG